MTVRLTRLLLLLLLLPPPPLLFASLHLRNRAQVLRHRVFTELLRHVQAKNATLRTDRARRDQAKRSIWSEGRLQDLAETRRSESNVFRQRHELDFERRGSAVHAMAAASVHSIVPQLTKLPHDEPVLDALLLRWEMAARREYGVAPAVPPHAFEIVMRKVKAGRIAAGHASGSVSEEERQLEFWQARAPAAAALRRAARPRAAAAAWKTSPVSEVRSRLTRHTRHGRPTQKIQVRVSFSRPGAWVSNSKWSFTFFLFFFFFLFL